MNQSLVAYLDHQVWCGTAEKSPKYLSLENLLEKTLNLQNFLIPYSIVHIRELAEIGKMSGLSKAERFEKALPKLEFIKKISRSTVLEANDDYSKFTLSRRDPIEAFETVTEVELEGVATHNFTDFIPKEMVQEIQKYFNVGAEKLNDMTEEDAVGKINAGFKSFAEKCLSDTGFHRAVIDASKKQSEQLVLRGHHQSLSALDQTIQVALTGLGDDSLNEFEKQTVQNLISTLERKKSQLKSQLQFQIQALQDACEKSYSSRPVTYSFDLLLDQTEQFSQGKVLPRSLNRAFLLDFFGYKSKLKNRRSDYYDALHREYAKACKFFVTNDTKLQQKLGVLNSLIVGTKCQLLNSAGFEQVVERILSNEKARQSNDGKE